MTQRDLETLEEGDVVRGKLSGQEYIIVRATYKKKAIGIRAVEVSSPDEWELISKGVSPEKVK